MPRVVRDLIARGGKLFPTTTVSILLYCLIAVEVVKLWSLRGRVSDIPAQDEDLHWSKSTGGGSSKKSSQGYELSGSRWDLMDCVNHNQEHNKPTTWASALSPRPASLSIVSIWWSSKPATIPVTITTQLSAARLWQLRALCLQYPGPVSAALYIAVARGSVLKDRGSLSFMVNQAQLMHQAMEATGRCKLDLMLVREVLDDVDAKNFYPVNQLRNLARLQARTPLIAIVDADLLVSPLLAEAFLPSSAFAGYVQRLSQERVPEAVVLPAFQVPSSIPMDEAMNMADHAITFAKDELRKWFDLSYVVQFDPGKPGHNATDYPRWFSTNTAYQVQYQDRYEPWVVCDRREVPWHDGNFKGYGLNKIMHIEHMNSTGYRLTVHPDAFLIHRAHLSTAAKKMVLEAKKETRMLELQDSQQGPAENDSAKAAAAAAVAAEGAQSSPSSTAEDHLMSQQPRRALRALLDQMMEEGRQGLLEGDVGASVGGSRGLQKGSKQTSAYAYTQKLGQQARQDMRQGRYHPHVDKAICICLNSLSWWK